MKAILDVLAFSSAAGQDRRAFVKGQLLFWLMAATDAHAKNFSLFHETGGTYRMTPFYDVLSAWPIIGHGPNQLAYQKAELAMAVRSKNAHWKLKDIQPRHWQRVPTSPSNIPEHVMLRIHACLSRSVLDFSSA